MFTFKRFSSLLCVILVAGLVTSCQLPAGQPLLYQDQGGAQVSNAAASSQSDNGQIESTSFEEIAAAGVKQALKLAPQVADEVSRNYWFALPATVPWWAASPVVFAEGDRSQGALRLQFHKQNYYAQSGGRLSDELGLMWQTGKVDGGPDTSFAWAKSAGIAVGDDYRQIGTCTIDGVECKVYLHHRTPSAGGIVWRIWYDDKADLTYALVTPGQEPLVRTAFEEDFRGS